MGNAISCTRDILYTVGHVYDQIVTSYPLAMVRFGRVRAKVRVRYDVAVSVYKCPSVYMMSHVHDVVNSSVLTLTTDSRRLMHVKCYINVQVSFLTFIP